MKSLRLNILFLAFSIMFFITANVGYAQIETKTKVDPHHDWLITFNIALDEKTINEKNIYVMKDTTIVSGIKLSLNKNQKTVTVYAPTTGYRYGETYRLFIRKEVQSIYGKTLKEEVIMKFVIKNKEIGKSQEEILQKWNTLKPTFVGNPFIEVPSITSPYSPGILKQPFLDDGLKMTNFIRYLADLPSDLTLDENFNEEGQYGAVVTAANGYLSHYPNQPDNMSEQFYQFGLNSTSSSNLSQHFIYKDWNSAEFDRGIKWGTLAGSVYHYMMDEDSTNIDRVGHRRWILNPKLQKTGFGYAVLSKSPDHPFYTTFSPMKVFDTSRTEAFDFEFIGWPSSGNFPNEFLKSEVPWSVSLNQMKYQKPDINEVVVKLKRKVDGEIWTLNKQDNNIQATSRHKVLGEYFNINNLGYGIRYCIIFRPEPTEINEYIGEFEVTIEGLKDFSGNSKTLQYTVNFFDMLK